MNEGGLKIVEGYLARLRMNICPCCGLKARGANASAPDECACEIYEIHDECRKCAEHCPDGYYVNYEGEWVQ